MSGKSKIPAKREKTVGCRVDDIQYHFIMKQAKLENLNQSDFIMKSMAVHTNLKKYKMIIIESIDKYLKDVSIFFDLDKKQKLQEALSYLVDL